MKHELVLVLDFGGQYNQLIARRVREEQVYCEVHPYTMTLAEIRAKAPKGIILTGGPQSVYGEGALSYDAELFSLGIPVLGICYGSQLMAHALGGRVEAAPVSEYGRTEVGVTLPSSKLFAGVPTMYWGLLGALDDSGVDVRALAGRDMYAHSGTAEKQRTFKFALGYHGAGAEAYAVEHEIGVAVLGRADADVGYRPALRLQMRDDRFLQRKAGKVGADQYLLILDGFHAASSL